MKNQTDPASENKGNASSKLRINKRTRFIALVAILGAQALVLSYLENLIPAIPGLPPGAKPGFSNIVTMFAASSIGFSGAISVTVIKSVFAGITRGATAFFMSACGGILSTIVMVLLLKIKNNPFGIIGISILSAIAHNAGQLAVACIMSGTPALLWGYGPLLLIFAVVTGSVTGILLRVVLPALEKQAKMIGM